MTEIKITLWHLLSRTLPKMVLQKLLLGGDVSLEEPRNKWHRDQPTRHQIHITPANSDSGKTYKVDGVFYRRFKMAPLNARTGEQQKPSRATAQCCLPFVFQVHPLAGTAWVFSYQADVRTSNLKRFQTLNCGLERMCSMFSPPYSLHLTQR